MSDKSKEIEAIEAIGKQIEGFKSDLGKKADATQFKAVEDTLLELRALIDKLEGEVMGEEELAAEVEEEVEEKMKKVNAFIEKTGKQIAELMEAVNQNKDGVGIKSKKGEFVTRKQIEDFIAKTFVDNQKTSQKAAITLKAAEVFGYPTFFEGGEGTDITAFTGRFIDPTLYQRKRKRNLILDNFTIETIPVPTLIYLVKEEIGSGGESDTDPGSAEWIVSGAAKPMRSFRVTTGTVDAKKVAIFGTVEDKLLRDVASLENWIREDFTQEILEAVNDALLNNNPSVDPNAPLGLKQNAIQYGGTPAFSGQIEDANYIDAIMAVAAYMATLHEKPGKVFVSDDVFYAMLVLKDNEARYQNNPLVYTNNLGQLYIGGVQIVPSDAEDVPSTHILAISDDLGFKIKAYGPMVFERGLNGTDFREDKTSFRGYQEFLSYIPEHRYNSVLYDTFANVIAEISAGS